jgi:hypothetical protein
MSSAHHRHNVTRRSPRRSPRHIGQPLAGDTSGVAQLWRFGDLVEPIEIDDVADAMAVAFDLVERVMHDTVVLYLHRSRLVAALIDHPGTHPLCATAVPNVDSAEGDSTCHSTCDVAVECAFDVAFDAGDPAFGFDELIVLRVRDRIDAGPPSDVDAGTYWSMRAICATNHDVRFTDLILVNADRALSVATWCDPDGAWSDR